MYSPKISSHLIPLLYRVSKARRVHMTTLVNEVIAAYLAQQPDADAIPPDQSRPRASSCRGSAPDRASSGEPHGPVAGSMSAAPRV